MMRLIGFMSLVVTLSATSLPADAQSPAEFYRGKTVNLDIGTSAGGGYDLHGRFLARHMGKYIPGNPTVIARNVEGAGGLRLANILYNSAPRDGTSFGLVFRNVPFQQLLGNKSALFDASKFTWIGSSGNEVSLCVAWHTSGVTSIDDLRRKEMIVGSISSNSDTSIFAKVINGVFDTRMKIVNGYPGGNEISIAMERGELGGRCAWSWSSVKATRISWIEQKQMHIFVQLGLSKHPDLPDVPLVVDLAQAAEQRDLLKLVFARQEVAWPFVAPPGVPKDRADALRSAFDATVRDKAFLADITKAQLEVLPMAGADVQSLIAEVHSTPGEVVAKAADMIK
jgi:tripartite-type tricarboxylate transporter receptor subunit TctC